MLPAETGTTLTHLVKNEGEGGPCVQFHDTQNYLYGDGGVPPGGVARGELVNHEPP
jgi:hypothetical protein